MPCYLPLRVSVVRARVGEPFAKIFATVSRRLYELEAFSRRCICGVVIAARHFHGAELVTGAISGTVADPSGAVIVGASLTLKNNATGESLTTTSGGTGGYQFTLLTPGTYSLVVSQTGFKQASEAVEVHLGQIATVNLKMEVGSGTDHRRGDRTGCDVADGRRKHLNEL